MERRDAGASLVSMLVGVSILGILAAVLIQFTGNSLAAAREIARRGELEDLRRAVRARLDCRKTVAAMGDGARIRLLDGRGKPIAEETADGAHAFGSSASVKVVRWSKDTGVLQVVARTQKDGQFEELFTKGGPLVCF